MDTDFLLIKKMKNGDDTAIETFVRKYYPKILQYCRLHISDYGYAEDMTQETFEKFFRSFENYRHYGKAVNYLYVIASNTCKDYYKKKQEISIEDVEKEIHNLRAENVEEEVFIEIAIYSLPKELKDVAILYILEQLKQKEIARILGISIPLVKYRIRKAKEYLKKLLGKE